MIFKKQTIWTAKIITLFLSVVAVWFVLVDNVHAQLFVDDPADCPQSYSGQNCSPNKVCGLLGGTTAQCYDTDSLTPPPGNFTATGSVTASFSGGGYLLNCYGIDSAPNPYCNNNGNWWCDRSETCYTTYRRETTCIGGEIASSTCGASVPGYTYCDGSYEDGDGCEITINSTAYPGETNAVYNSSCNPVCASTYNDCNGDLGLGGNGCEIRNGSACMLAGLPGTYQGCSGSAGNCVIPVQNFQTGTEAKYSTTTPLLWGTQYGTGYLAKLLSNNASTSGGVFTIDNNGRVGIGTTTPGAMLTVGTSSGSQFLVNNSGVVSDGTWNGDAIGLGYGGLGADFSGSTGFLYVSGGAVTASSSLSIAQTDLTAIAPLSLIGHSLTLDTSGDWSGTLDGYNGSDFFTLNAWFENSSAPQLTSLSNLSTVGTISSGTWQGNVIMSLMAVRDCLLLVRILWFMPVLIMSSERFLQAEKTKYCK